jgi:hypothetical protein
MRVQKMREEATEK